jgi:inhibitor of KinA sporulation pathway (predicted exonuclease)
MYNIIDLELNSWPSKRAIGIVEVGIVEMDHEFNVTRTVSKFVRPDVGFLTDSTASLTGIKPEEILSADKLDMVMTRLVKDAFFNKRVVVAWGTDYETIQRELCATYLHPFDVINAQVLYSIWTNRSPLTRISLSQASIECGIEFAGTKHRALDDAIQTAKIFKYMMDQRVEPDNE